MFKRSFADRRTLHEANDAYDVDLFRGDLFDELSGLNYLAKRSRGLDLIMASLVCAVIYSASVTIAQVTDIPTVLWALILGLVVSEVLDDEKRDALARLGSSGLRWGVVLLGFQIDLAQIMSLGIAPFVGLIAVVAAASVGALSHALFRPQPRGILILAGGATAICGVTAAIAIYALLGRFRPQTPELLSLVTGTRIVL